MAIISNLTRRVRVFTAKHSYTEQRLHTSCKLQADYIKIASLCWLIFRIQRKAAILEYVYALVDKGVGGARPTRDW